MTQEVAIVGGGPAGLATAIALAQKGISATVLERRTGEMDKACGEGLMPHGAATLERLGVRSLLDPNLNFPFHSIRYVQEDGHCAEGRLPPSGGLGIRRTALIEALRKRAQSLGVDIRLGWALQKADREGSLFRLHGPGQTFTARLLIAADGLHSPLRKSFGLETASRQPLRYGLRRHFFSPPQSACVEVHLRPELEAYLTPVSPTQMGVAFLWQRGRIPGSISFDSLLSLFPALADRFKHCEPSSAAVGAGPFFQTSHSQVADQLALVGDAAGYVDAITGEGLTLALRSAESLADVVPQALLSGADRSSLLPYQQNYQRAFRQYARTARMVLALARTPKVRRVLVHALGLWPDLFNALLSQAL